MCNGCNNDNKNSLSNMLAIISGIVMLAAAVSAAVYFVMKYFEKKERCDYIECDCYGDYDGYEQYDDEPHDEPEKDVEQPEKKDAAAE